MTSVDLKAKINPYNVFDQIWKANGKEKIKRQI